MKLKNHIGSIFFLAAATASAAYGVVTERSGINPRTMSDRERAESRVFPSFDRAALTQIHIERAEGKLTLVRANAAEPFRMTSPQPAATDVASVDQLVAALELASLVRRVTESPPSAGAAPRARGMVSFGTKSVGFSLGAPAPVPEGASYLDVEGVGTVVVARELASELLRPFDAYRDRTLVPMPVSDIVRFEVKNPERTFVLERLDDASFRVPGGARASRDLTDRWASAIPELRAVTFVRDGSDAGAGARLGGSGAAGDATARSLTVTARDGRVVVVRFEGPCPDGASDVVAVVEQPEKIAACVPRVIAAAFDVSPALAWDRRLFLARPDETSDISIEAASGVALSLARVGSGFRERQPRARDLEPAENEAAAALVARVLAVSGATVTAPPVASPIAVRLSIARVGTEARERVEIVDASGAHFARRLADGAWLSLSASARRALEPPPNGVRAQALVGRGFSIESAQRLVVKCGGVAETLARKDGNFVLEAPHGLPADTSRALALVELVVKSRARDIALDAPKTKESCTLAVGWSADGGALETTLSFRATEDDAGPSDVLVQRDGEREWLVVDGALKRALEEPLVDRGAIAWSADGADRITVVRSAAPAGKPRGDTGAEGARWQTALRDLRASRVERVGPSPAEEGFGAPLVELRLLPGADGGAPVFMRFVRAKAPGELLVRRSDLDATFRIAEDAVPPEAFNR